MSAWSQFVIHDFAGADPASRLFSFGNGRQAIEIARACLGRLFQMRFEIVEQSN
jgi:hypothetical protein